MWALKIVHLIAPRCYFALSYEVLLNVCETLCSAIDSWGLNADFWSIFVYREPSFQDSDLHTLATSASFNSNIWLNSTKSLCYAWVPYSCTMVQKVPLYFSSLSYHCHGLHVFQGLKTDVLYIIFIFLLVCSLVRIRYQTFCHDWKAIPMNTIFEGGQNTMLLSLDL